MSIETWLFIIAALLFVILLRVDSIARRLKERFPTEKEEDLAWAKHGHSLEQGTWIFLERRLYHSAQSHKTTSQIEIRLPRGTVQITGRVELLTLRTAIESLLQ